MLITVVCLIQLVGGGTQSLRFTFTEAELSQFRAEYPGELKAQVCTHVQEAFEATRGES